MNLKLTAIPALLFTVLLATSCEKDDLDPKADYAKTAIPMTGAQVVPASTSPGTGSLDVSYSIKNKILSYTFTWSGLRDTITGVAIHGPAPTGYASATIKQALPGFGSDLKANQATYPFQGGKYTGTVVIDNVVLKEQDLLNHLYYLNIRTKAGPAGEIRGQIRFQ